MASPDGRLLLLPPDNWLSVAIEGLQEALRQRETTPGEIAAQAEHGGVATVIRPYLEALTVGK